MVLWHVSGIQKDSSIFDSAQYSLYVFSDGTLRLGYYNGAPREIDLKAGVTRNTWHHVTVTILGTTLNCWYDGIHVIVGYSLAAPLVSHPAVPLFIGAQKSGTGISYPLEGFISEVAIYNISLSDTQCELMYQGQYPETSNLSLFLSSATFDWSTDTWNDQSGNSNNGVVHQAGVILGALQTSFREVVRPIWDQIKVNGYSSDDPCIDVGTPSSNYVSLAYSFNNKPVVDGTVFVNGLPASPGVDENWIFSDTRLSAQEVVYNSVSYSGGVYGLSSVDQNSQQVSQTWDEILILTTVTIDPYVNVGHQAEIRVIACLTCSSHLLGISDTLYMNGEKMEYSISGQYFYYRPTQYSVGLWTFSVNTTGASEQTYGITAVNTNGLSVGVTWDGLIVSITGPLNQHLNIVENASGISYSVVYASDGSPFDGTAMWNDTIFIHAIAGKHGYSLIPLGDDSRGISYVETADETFCIWDSVSIDITGPVMQAMLLGENASGIHVTGYYDYSGLPFDGQIQLNSTTFIFYSEGKRGYTVQSISGDSFGITTISQNDETFGIWLDGYPVDIHVSPLISKTLVSTEYDLHCFRTELWMTNESGYTVSGWINISIGEESFSVYYDGMAKTTFEYYPGFAASFTLEAYHESDGYYGYARIDVSGFKATLRGITCSADIPSSVPALVETSFPIDEIHDAAFSGVYDGVTYIRDYPIDASISVWWTLSPTYEGPLNYVGSWDVDSGCCTATWALPWDLDGDGKLTSADFVCYLVIEINGHGIYENVTIDASVDVLHSLDLDMTVPFLTFSDTGSFVIRATPLHDDTYKGHLGLDVSLYTSDDNSTWHSIASSMTNQSGYAEIDWYCNVTGSLFFKIESDETPFYVSSRRYAHTTADKEVTQLAIERVGNFTYSDQGVLVASLKTDDGEPVALYSVFVEILDNGAWVSIGSGVTNATGQVSILWIPDLPANVYDFRVLALFTESQYYYAPANVGAQLAVGKERLVLSIDTTNANDGYVQVRVTDDENVTLHDIAVNLFLGDSTAPVAIKATNQEGYVMFQVMLKDGESIRATVNENEFYRPASESVVVYIPLDFMAIGSGIGIIALASSPIVLLISYIRKRRNAPKPGMPASPDELRSEVKEMEDAKVATREKYMSLLGGSGDSESPLSAGGAEIEDAPSHDDVTPD